MEGRQSEYDFLNYFDNHTVKNNITREEEILFTDKILKVNKYGWKQERNIIITDKAIYNLKKTSLKRRIDFRAIRGITISNLSDEFVIHCKDIDYDYQFISNKKKTIIELIGKYYEAINETELKLFGLNVKGLSTFVTTKKEKEKEKNSSRMPTTGAISLNDFLFGSGPSTSVVSSSINKRKTTFNNIKVQFDDFEIVKTIGRGSVGKILLVKYISSGDFYVMKTMRKDQLISEGIVDNILVERNILIDGQCEFILSLSFFFQTPERIYLVTPFIKGGDLYHKLKLDGFLKEEVVRFYASQIAVALQHIHDLGIAYRDLKPENILIGEDGYLKLCDFGSSVRIRGTQKETSFAGSPEYAAPEMINQEGHTFMCDWWSFGVLIYEMLFGITPFFNMDKNRMYDLIMTGGIAFPKQIEIEGTTKSIKVSDDAKSLISKLLEKDPGTRLGRKGLKEIKKHPFFSGVNFETLNHKKQKAPFKPTIDKEDPTSNFDDEFLTMEVNESPVADWISEHQNWFEGFDDIEGMEEAEAPDQYEEGDDGDEGKDDD